MVTQETYDEIMQQLLDLPQRYLDVLLLFRDPHDNLCLCNKVNG